MCTGPSALDYTSITPAPRGHGMDNLITNQPGGIVGGERIVSTRSVFNCSNHGKLLS